MEHVKVEVESLITRQGDVVLTIRRPESNIDEQLAVGVEGC